MKMFRWEYEHVNGPVCMDRRWYIYHEAVPVLVEHVTLAAAREYLEPNDPAWPGLREALEVSRERIDLMPWEPVGVSPETLTVMGEDFVERVQRKPHDCKVWDLKNGHVWLHVPGDSAR